MGNYTHNDGGRKAAGYRGECDDCAVRAAAIATGLPYGQVYKVLGAIQAEFARGRSRAARSAELARVFGRGTPRHGVFKDVFRRYMDSLGWKWTPTMQIGSGCKVHLRADELPSGHIICAVSKHYVAVIDGAIHDTHDCSRGGTRCVYGYFSRA